MEKYLDIECNNEVYPIGYIYKNIEFQRFKKINYYDCHNAYFYKSNENMKTIHNHFREIKSYLKLTLNSMDNYIKYAENINEFERRFPYNYQSLLHYFKNSFAIDRTKPTLIPKKKDSVLAVSGATRLPDLDVQAVRYVYNCGPKPRLQTGDDEYNYLSNVIKKKGRTLLNDKSTRRSN
jgi:hypothetical protein